MTARNRVSVEERIGARCLACGYSLRGLASVRCPECGREFDLENPWSVWLPGRPNRLAQWLLQPPPRVARLLPTAAIGGALWGTRIPGYGDAALWLGVILLVSAIVSTWARNAAVAFVRRRGYADRQPDERFIRWRRQANVAALVFVAVVVIRPALYGCFWLSKPWMDRQARAILTQPFATPARGGGGVRGLHNVSHVKRCPHGVKIVIRSTRVRFDTDSGPGFFYRIEAGECERFEIGQPLGGGWYVSH